MDHGVLSPIFCDANQTKGYDPCDCGNRFPRQNALNSEDIYSDKGVEFWQGS